MAPMESRIVPKRLVELLQIVNAALQPTALDSSLAVPAAARPKVTEVLARHHQRNRNEDHSSVGQAAALQPASAARGRWVVRLGTER